MPDQPGGDERLQVLARGGRGDVERVGQVLGPRLAETAQQDEERPALLREARHRGIDRGHAHRR
jgi:hypothetical protein